MALKMPPTSTGSSRWTCSITNQHITIWYMIIHYRNSFRQAEGLLSSPSIAASNQMQSYRDSGMYGLLSCASTPCIRRGRGRGLLQYLNFLMLFPQEADKTSHTSNAQIIQVESWSSRWALSHQAVNIHTTSDHLTLACAMKDRCYRESQAKLNGREHMV